MNYLILCASAYSRQIQIDKAKGKYPNFFKRETYNSLSGENINFIFFTSADFYHDRHRGIRFDNFSEAKILKFEFKIKGSICFSFHDTKIPNIKIPGYTCCFCDQEKDFGLLRNTEKGLCRDCVKLCYESHVWQLSQKDKDYKLQLLQEILGEKKCPPPPPLDKDGIYKH